MPRPLRGTEVPHLTSQLTALRAQPRRRQIELTFCGVQYANPDGHSAGQNNSIHYSVTWIWLIISSFININLRLTVRTKKH